MSDFEGPLRVLFEIGGSHHEFSSRTLYRWDPMNRFLVTIGSNNRVNVWRRDGTLVHQFPVSTTSTEPCADIRWDKDGQTLAVLQKNTSQIMLWTMQDLHKVTTLETNVKNPTFIRWSIAPGDNILAVGSVQGNLMLYNARTSKKQQLHGRHGKRITCGGWNSYNKLALAGEDKMLTISNAAGKLLDQSELEMNPVELRFSEQKVDGKTDPEGTISVNLSSKKILLYRMSDPDDVIKLEFSKRYGDVVRYHWFGDGYLLIGFHRGNVVVISTHIREVGNELQSLEVFQNELYDVAYGQGAQKFAAIGDDGLHVVDMTDWKEVKSQYTRFSEEDGEPVSLYWSNDGQILTCSTTRGKVISYLMSIPSVSGGYGSSDTAKIAYLSSLKHVCVKNMTDRSVQDVVLEIAIEPGFIAMGKNHVAVGMNNSVWYYNPSESHEPVSSMDYMGVVEEIQLNDQYVALLTDGKCHLHPIESTADGKQQRHTIFPDKDANERVTHIGLCNDFLIYNTDKGSIHQFYLRDWKEIDLYRHDKPSKHVFPNTSGTRVVVIDESNEGYLYNPVNGSILQIENFPLGAENVLWDAKDAGVFVVIDMSTLTATTYMSMVQSLRGPRVKKISQTSLPFGYTSILLDDGVIYGQKGSGAIAQIVLESHEALRLKGGRRDAERLKQCLKICLNLCKFKIAWKLAEEINTIPAWEAFGSKALELLDVETALLVFQRLQKADMVLALTDLQYVDDMNTLAGHICMLQGNYKQAQSLFLDSANPQMALTMRRDLLDWEQALALAQNLDQKEVPFICREHAAQLEVMGEYQDALSMFQRAKKEISGNGFTYDDEVMKNHLRLVTAGIARNTLRLSDLLEGVPMALKSGDKHLMSECASILYGMKQFGDAAEMYVAAEKFEKAAAIYLQTKKFAKVGPLMAKITTPKLHAKYAKAKEHERDYKAAAESYERAKDIDSVIRLNLQFLDNPEKAFHLVREHASSEGASMVAQYCQRTGHFQSAIEFLLLAKRSEEAFKMAVDHKQMDKFALALGEDGSPKDYLDIAHYYETQNEWGEAGRFYGTCGEYEKAVQYYLKCGEKKIDDAIALVKQAKGSDMERRLFKMIHDWLLGFSDDGRVRDYKYLFELYKATEEFAQMVDTAVLIAHEEMQVGSYSAARDYLRDTWQHLRDRNMAIPYKLRADLRLVQTYLLAKRLAGMNNLENAARVLIYTAKNISKFPSHVVKILTSTVVLCKSAGLKRTSYEYACQLMQPEYRSLVDAKVRKRFEQLVRRPVKEEKEEDVSPCPFCQFEIPESQLDCSNCKNRIPFCIATGKHMVLSDWTKCPQCKFPALFTPFVKQIAECKTCPMCEKNVQLTDIEKFDIDDAKAQVQAHGSAEKPPVLDDDVPPPAFGDGENVQGEAPQAPRQGFQ